MSKNRIEILGHHKARAICFCRQQQSTMKVRPNFVTAYCRFEAEKDGTAKDLDSRHLPGRISDCLGNQVCTYDRFHNINDGTAVENEVCRTNLTNALAPCEISKRNYSQECADSTVTQFLAQ